MDILRDKAGKKVAKNLVALRKRKGLSQESYCLIKYLRQRWMNFILSQAPPWPDRRTLKALGNTSPASMDRF